MAGSTLKALILVAAVVLGVVLLKGAFPENASQGITGSPSPRKTTTPSPTTSPSATGPTTSGTPKRNSKVVILVLNGAGRTGLAGQVTDVLKAEHYKLKEPGDAPRTNTTTIFYRSDSLAEAQVLQDFMQKRYGLTIDIQPAGEGFPAGIRLQVVLGKDFLTAPTP